MPFISEKREGLCSRVEIAKGFFAKVVGADMWHFFYSENPLHLLSALCRMPRHKGQILKMKSYREEMWFETKTRRAYLNITPQVEAAVKKSGIAEGMVLVNAMHITSSVYINDDETGLLEDYDNFLERLVPQKGSYRHNETGEDNGDAHIKRQIMGREVVVALTQGQLDFGPWEQIFYGEFDGRRRKRVLVKIIGE